MSSFRNYALNDREVLNIAYVYGAKLSPDGRLLFQPSTNGIDVLDGRLGNLLTRISLPVALSTGFDALVADGNDNVVIAITGTDGTGIAVVDLTSIAEPPSPPYDSGMQLRPRPFARSIEPKSSTHGSGEQLHRSAQHPSIIRHVTRPLVPLRK